MTFSYDAARGSRLDTIRLLIGDTDPGSVLLSDEELQRIIDDAPPQRIDEWVAYDATQRVLPLLARRVTVSVGAVRVDLSAQHTAMVATADRLWRLAGLRSRGENDAAIRVTGQDRAENEARDYDAVAEPNRFRRGQFDSENWLYADADRRDRWDGYPAG